MVIVALIFAGAAIMAIVLFCTAWMDESHEVYDTGNGIKVKCPEGDGLSRVVYGSEIFCPFCSLKLKPPKRKYRWERR